MSRRGDALQAGGTQARRSAPSKKKKKNPVQSSDERVSAAEPLGEKLTLGLLLPLPPSRL